MVKIGLQLKADLENLTDLHVVGEDFRWYMKVKCGNCGEMSSEFVYVCGLEKVAMKGSRGEANLVMKCRFCGRENNMIDLVPGSVNSYNAEDSGKFKTIAAFNCRGIEPTAFDVRAGWAAKGAETTSKFEEIDLKELDDMNNIVRWSILNNLPLNITKCKSISFGQREASQLCYMINDAILQQVSEIKDLGITITPLSASKSTYHLLFCVQTECLASFGGFL